jgi:hypothetical protein
MLPHSTAVLCCFPLPLPSPFPLPLPSSSPGMATGMECIRASSCAIRAAMSMGAVCAISSGVKGCRARDGCVWMAA